MTKSGDGIIGDESKMSRVDLSREEDKEEFAFLKDEADMEWEDKELDRAWYDADEDSNIRYGGVDLMEDFMGV